MLALWGILAACSFFNQAFGWIRSFDWLQKNQPAIWAVLVTPEFNLTLGIVCLGLLAWGVYGALHAKEPAPTRDDSKLGTQSTQGNFSPIAGRDMHFHGVQSSSVADIPKVIAVKFGRSSDGYREGLYIENDGATVFEVKPDPLILPDGVQVTFDSISTLKKGDRAFCFSHVELSPTSGAIFLDADWIRLANKHPGFTDSELPLRIVYRDYGGNWFRCICVFKRDVGIHGDSPFSVTTMRQERI